MTPLETFALSKAVKNVSAACSDIIGLRVKSEHALEALDALGPAAPADASAHIRSALSDLLAAGQKLTAVRQAMRLAEDKTPAPVTR